VGEININSNRNSNSTKSAQRGVLKPRGSCSYLGFGRSFSAHLQGRSGAAEARSGSEGSRRGGKKKGRGKLHGRLGCSSIFLLTKVWSTFEVSASNLFAAKTMWMWTSITHVRADVCRRIACVGCGLGCARTHSHA
jgi:hypothetical protein